MSSDQNYKAFLQDARGRADDVLAEVHIGADVKNLIKDLLQIAESLEGMMAANSGQSSDVRVLRKKLDASKGEIRAAETKAENLKGQIVGLATELKAISTETGVLLKADPAHPQGLKLKASAQKMAEIIITASQS